MSQEQESKKPMRVIEVPQFLKLREEIKWHHESKEFNGLPCMILQGPPRTGKTTLVLHYARRFPLEETELGRNIPILYLTLPYPLTFQSLVRKMLQVTGDSQAYTIADKLLNSRLLELIRASRIQLIIFDEFYLIRRISPWKAQLEFDDWLPVFVKEAQIPFLMVTPEEEVDFLRSNPQLAQLCKAPAKLQPFEWNISKETTTNREFAQFVQSAEEAVGVRLPWRSEYDRDLLYRIHYATDGVIGYLMDLMQSAARIASGQKQELDFSILAVAFEKYRPMCLSAINPFHPCHGEIFSPAKKAQTDFRKATRRNVGLKKPARSLK